MGTGMGRGTRRDAGGGTVTPAEIIHAVADARGVLVRDIRDFRRYQRVTRARHEAWWLIRTLTELSFPDIGRETGGHHHTSVMSGVEQVRERCLRDPNYAAGLLLIAGVMRRDSALSIAMDETRAA